MDIANWLHHYGYVSLFIVMFLEVVGIPSLAESALIASGMQLHLGTFAAIPLLFAVIGGSVAGATVAYVLGRFLGRPFVERFGPKFGITPERLDYAEESFRKYGLAVIVIGKWLPGVQVLIPYLGGTNLMPFAAFSVYNFFGTVIWVLAFLIFGESLASLWQRIAPVLTARGLLATAVVVGLAVWMWWSIRSRRAAARRSGR